MKTGLKPGAAGEIVERLHRILIASGRNIARAEIDRHRFGASTLAALQAFQAEHRLRKTRQINRETLVLLLEFEENITININEAAAPKGTAEDKRNTRRGPRKTRRSGCVSARWHQTFSLLGAGAKRNGALGTATTNAQGQYKIAYRRPQR